MSRNPVADQIETLTIPAAARPYLRWTGNENMTCRQAAILAIVEGNPGVSVGAIAHVMGIPKPGVTRALDKMELWGMVYRTHGKTDRRLIEIHAQKYPAPARMGSTRGGG